MDYRRAFPKEFLTAHWLIDEKTGRAIDAALTIKACVLEDLQIPGQSEKERKLVLTFAELEKGSKEGKPHKLVLNVTNANTIAAVTGSNDTDEWTGKRITLYPTTTKFGRDTVECIRVRPKAPAPKG